MKRILSVLIVCLVLLSTLTACGNDTILFNGIKFSKYVDLGEYKGIEVDTSSDLLKGYYDDEILGDIASKNLYVKITEGEVKDGDTVYIDYVGKKDGVAFEGGSAENYPLTIGSGSFIDGFEEGLIGVTIGDTVDINLTFPEDYGNEELNGAAVVFTVTVHYVSTDEERKPEEYYSEIGFETLEEYEKDVWERAVKMYLLETLVENSEIKDYPEDDIEFIYSFKENQANTTIKNQYNVDLNTYLTAYSSSLEDYKQNIIDSDIKPDLDIYLLYYNIIDNEGIEITADMVSKYIDSEAKTISDEEGFKQKLIDYYGEYYFEVLLVREKALDVMYDNANIK